MAGPDSVCDHMFRTRKEDRAWSPDLVRRGGKDGHSEIVAVVLDSIDSWDAADTQDLQMAPIP